MATLTTVSAVNHALVNSVPSVRIPTQENYGRVRYAYDSYSKAAGDEFGTSGIINMMKIPKGAKVIQATLAMEASGTAGIFDIGWAAGVSGAEAADADGFFAAQDPGAAAITGLNMISTRPGWNKTFAEEVQVQMDCTEATAGGAACVFELSIWYVID